MLTPAYKLTLGRQLVDTTADPRASTVVDLALALDLDTPADCLTLTLGGVGSLRPARDDQAIVELGYAGDEALTRVFSGTVASVEPGVTTTRVTAYSGANALLRTRVDQTFERATAGAIVRSLAESARLRLATVRDGITFPAYVIDGERTVYVHMYELAELCGFDLYIDPQGALMFAPFAGGAEVHVFEHGRHIVDLEVRRFPPLAGLVETWGESSTGSRGDDAWAWLTKDFRGTRGSAGSGARLLLERAALRTTDAARMAAEAALTAIQRRTVRGSLRTIGRPQVKLGDAIRLRSMPDETLNTTFQVRSVVHRITKRGGFTTTIGFRAIDV
jgi:phage protein D